MVEQLLTVGLSAVFTLVTLVLGVVVALLWKERHLPFIGFLLIFLFSIFIVDGLSAIILIGRASYLLPEDGLLLGALGFFWFLAQFCQSIPALMVGLYGLGIISAKWITWLFKPKERELGNDKKL